MTPWIESVDRVGPRFDAATPHTDGPVPLETVRDFPFGKAQVQVQVTPFAKPAPELPSLKWSTNSAPERVTKRLPVDWGLLDDPARRLWTFKFQVS